ncbi:MAG: methyl-accepting chemotaxis protein, partial [Archaeoglobaceae archaeon]|nr:methyl-accepting chemotaxis protein [Archaeoglobaceae archaeon]
MSANSTNIDIEGLGKKIEDRVAFLEKEIKEREKKIQNLQKELEKSRKLLDAIFRAIPKPLDIYFIDRQGVIRYVNEASAEMFQRPIEEIIGKRPSEIFYADKERTKTLADVGMKTTIERALEEGGRKYEGVELKYLIKDRELFMLTSGAPVYVDGELQGMVGFFVDVTKIKEQEEMAKRALELAKQKEEEARDAQRLVENILNSIPVAVVMMDSDKTVRFWNKACEDLTGVKAEEVVGTKDAWKAFYTTKRPTFGEVLIDNLSNVEKLYEKVYRSKVIDGAWVVEARFELPRNKRVVHFRTTGVPIMDENGRIKSVVVAMEDIKDLRDREKEIQDTLNYTNECLSRLIAAVKQLSEGNLKVRLNKMKDDEFGRAFDEFNEFIERLGAIVTNLASEMKTTTKTIGEAREAIKQLTAGMEQISTASQQIATGSENLSKLANTALGEVKA